MSGNTPSGTMSQSLSTLLSAQQFTARLRRFPAAARGKMIGHAIVYHTLFSDGQGFDQFMEEHEQRVDELGDEYPCDFQRGTGELQITARHLADKLGIDDRETPQAVFEFFREQYVQKGYLFYGFNGVFRTSIERHGLDPSRTMWDRRGFDGINKILNSESFFVNFGETSRGAVYADAHPFRAYGHAIESPLWFGLFAAGRLQLHGGDKYTMDAFARRDRGDAYGNVLGLCNMFNLSPQDRNRILAFFDMYWTQFAGPESQPHVAMIEQRAVDVAPNGFLDFDEAKRSFAQASTSTLIELGMDSFLLQLNNIRIEQSIPPSDIHIIPLPAYRQVYPEQFEN